jgi:hypothetical protein
VELTPKDFRQLVTQHDRYVIHCNIGVVVEWELYLTVSGGFIFITELKEPWRDLQVDFVAKKALRYLITKRRAGAEAVLGILAAFGGAYTSQDQAPRAACAPASLAVIAAEDFQRLAPKMLYIVKAVVDQHRGRYGYIGTFDHEMSYIAEGDFNLAEGDFEALGIHILYR